MGLTNYGENSMLNLFKGARTFYLGLFTALPGDDGGGTEISGGGYARQPVSFSAPSGGTMQNSEALEFPTATADWGAATGWGLFDAETGGNLWWYGGILEPKELYAGDIYRVAAGNLTLTMD